MSEVILTRALSGGRTLSLVHGNLVEEDVDAIVNAANEHLEHGGGVAGAIARAAGPALLEESRRIGFVPTGGAAITTGGSLKARHVIHAVGPIWMGGRAGEPKLLAQAVTAALEIADHHRLARMAMPAISTGIYGYPKEEGARVIAETTRQYVASHPDSSLREIRITLIDRASVDVFRRVLEGA